MAAPQRSLPNILVTGTPGVGKTTLSQLLCERTGLTHVNVGDLVKEHGYHAGKDDEFGSYLIDEDAENRILDDLEPRIAEGGLVVDHHTCDFFPERFFDLVLVLRATNTAVYDRLTERGYSAKKVEENVEAEIMQVVLEEARESYAEEVVHEIPSNEVADVEAGIQRVEAWMEAWKQRSA